MRIGRLSPALLAAGALCKTGDVDMLLPTGEAQLREVLAELKQNLVVDVDSLPYSELVTTEDTCFTLWNQFPTITFTEKWQLVSGRAVGRWGLGEEVSADIFVKRSVLMRKRNAFSSPIVLRKERSFVSVDNTTQGWTIGAQLSGGSPNLLSISASYAHSVDAHSVEATNGTQTMTLEEASFECPPLHQCHIESWVAYVKICGPCQGQSKVLCKDELDPCTWLSVPRCNQWNKWKDRVCSPREVCEIVTPVMEGSKPWVTEVFFEEPIRSLHRKPRITGYRNGRYLLGSDDYLYDPSREEDRYWAPDLGWHTHRIFPSLDDEVAKFMRRKPMILQYSSQCYELDTVEWYCPWREEEKQFYVEEEGFYAKPIAPKPGREDIAAFLDIAAASLEAKAGTGLGGGYNTSTAASDAESKAAIVKQYLKLYGADEGHPDVQDALGRSALSGAAMEGHAAMARLLVQMASADPNHRDFGSRTPLFLAVMMNHKDVVEALLEAKGVDPEARDWRGVTPFLLAQAEGYQAIARLLPPQTRSTAT